MPSYVVTGASRGIGYGFIQHLSQQPNTTVIGLVRNKALTEHQLDKDGLSNRENITILQADILDRPALLAARDAVAALTGGTLDYLINNAAYVSATSGKFLDDFEADNERQALDDDLTQSFNTNVIGVINTINIFLPLIRKSGVKKVVTLSTGMADPDLVTALGVWESAPYAISKAAVNMTVAKYAARYQDEGILFLAISPGVVATGAAQAPGDQETLAALFQKFAKYAPDFTGPLTPLESVEQMLKVIEAKSVANGDSGAFISHKGDKRWL